MAETRCCCSRTSKVDINIDCLGHLDELKKFLERRTPRRLLPSSTGRSAASLDFPSLHIDLSSVCQGTYIPTIRTPSGFCKLLVQNFAIL